MILPHIAFYVPGSQLLQKFSHHHTDLTKPINATAPDPRQAPTHTIASHIAHIDELCTFLDPRISADVTIP
ncbi:hypothetical protein KSX_00280 [Ktedonospora formicarum]|uniref:Uncharacterized protein n=1 Tax=Ktedonospora formicarum TaxID=2778364 RepID=A0A8J3HVQ1_9CHLR|nr:hypothetical protein KSX_00280 [Ktedonospora formicarum]